MTKESGDQPNNDVIIERLNRETDGRVLTEDSIEIG